MACYRRGRFYWLQSAGCIGVPAEGFVQGLGQIQKEVVDDPENLVSKDNVLKGLIMLSHFLRGREWKKVTDLIVYAEDDETRESLLVGMKQLCGCKSLYWLDAPIEEL